MRTFHPSWTPEMRRTCLKGLVNTEAHNAITAAQEREWCEVEKALKAMREVLEELWEMGL